MRTLCVPCFVADLRYLLTSRVPPVRRILLIESGPRHLLDHVVPQLREHLGGQMPIDLVTCYGGLPAGLNPDSTVAYNVANYRGRAGRKRLYQELKQRPPSILVMICSGVPIMAKWKWVLAARLPGKILIVNENADWFWLDRANWRTAVHVLLFRAGLSGAGAVRALARLVLFPFTLAYLLLYAAMIHLRRKVQG